MQIELEKVIKVYTSGWVTTCALHEISLGIDRGEFVSITGPSGSGKSSLIRIIGCLDQPTDGMYRLDGREIQGVSRAYLARIRNRKIGFLFMESNLISDMTVRENLELPLIYRGMSALQRTDHVYNTLDRVGLYDRADHVPGQLSIAQQQRVAVARAIVGQPEIIIADEPTGNLDTRSGSEIMELLLGVNKTGITLVMATHDPNLAEMAERSMSLIDGRIMA